MRKKITGYHVFSCLNILFMLGVTFVTFYPIYYIVVASISDPVALSQNYGLLWHPVGDITFQGYKMVFQNQGVIAGFKNTLFILVTGVLINMIMTTLGAFFLTIKGPKWKNVIAMMVVFTMYFNGGMVPSYLNVKELGLMNSIWSLILPGAITTTNLIIMKTAFEGIPDSLTESAQLDGATYWDVLWKIMIPLSKATLAVLVLYYGVAH